LIKHAKIIIMETIKSPSPHSAHQKQTLWQVWIPLIAGTLVVLLMAVLAVMTGMSGGGEEGGRLAGISLVIITIPSLIVCFFIIVILSLLIFGIYKLTVLLPVYSLKTLMYVVLASEYIHLWADRIVQPVVITREGLASLNRFLDVISLKPKK
jgi:hypothetical protein